MTDERKCPHVYGIKQGPCPVCDDPLSWHDLVKMTATTNFECDRSCGNIIDKGKTYYIIAGGNQVICFQCAVSLVYGPPPVRKD